MEKMKWLKTAMVAAVLAGMLCSPPVVQADGTPGSPDSSKPGAYWPQDEAAAGVFTGTWYAFVDNTAFTVTIQQDGRRLRAAHTAVYDYGRRVDSSGGGVSMSGVIEGATAFVEWKSGLSPETGKATIEYLPGRPPALRWQIIEKPKNPDDDTDQATTEVAYFIPKTAYLMRK